VVAEGRAVAAAFGSTPGLTAATLAVETLDGLFIAVLGPCILKKICLRAIQPQNFWTLFSKREGSNSNALLLSVPTRDCVNKSGVEQRDDWENDYIGVYPSISKPTDQKIDQDSFPTIPHTF
jgi:hypothetical protein